MNARQQLREVAVALVGDDDRGSGLGDEKVRTRNADIGGQESLPQNVARFGLQTVMRGDVAFVGEVGMGAAEIRLHLIARQMHGRRNDVRRHLAAELYDILAEVGFDRDETSRLDGLVEPDLFRDHRLALGDRAGSDAPADPQHGLSGFLGVAGEVNRAAALPNLLLIGFDIEIEVLEHVSLDVPRAIAKGFELRKLIDRLGALFDEGRADMAQRLLQRRVFERPMGVVLELG